MTTIDEQLERLRAEWQAVARYRVYIGGWYPIKKKIVLATGLRWHEARRRAAEEYELLKRRDPEVRGRIGDDCVELELENAEEAKAAYRRRHDLPEAPNYMESGNVT
jgi:hypothetical protein